jgi:hypothetical protein
MWQAVRQTWLVHPDWTVADHLAWLDGEGYDTDTADGDPAEVVGRWLTENRRAAALTPPPGATAEALVYVVAGGDMVAVFDNAVTAGIQRTVMEAAGLDTRAYTLTATHWESVRPLVCVINPGLVITDVRPGHDGGPA